MISKLEDLVQRVEDGFLQVLALPAVDESSFFLIKDVWQQSVKAVSGWGPSVANVRVERCSFSLPRSAPAQACRQSPPRASALRVPAISANGGGSEPG